MAQIHQAVGNLKELGDYDIPEWAVSAIENGDRDSLTEEDCKDIDEFLGNFPDGFVVEWNFENTDGFNRYPAFGLPCSTVPARFFHPSEREIV